MKRVLISDLSSIEQNIAEIIQKVFISELESIYLLSPKPVISSNQEAISIGKTYHADLVVWVKVISSDIIVYIERVNKKKTTINPDKINGLEQIRIYYNVGIKLEYLQFFLKGFILFLDHKYTDAITFFRNSLLNLENSIDCEYKNRYNLFTRLLHFLSKTYTKRVKLKNCWNLKVLYFFIGSSYYLQRDMGSSIDYFNRAISKAYTWYDTKKVVYNQDVYYLDSVIDHNIIICQNKALKIKKRLENEDFLSEKYETELEHYRNSEFNHVNCSRIAAACYSIGDYEGSIIHYLDALSLLKGKPHLFSNYINCLANLGNVYKSKEDFDSALNCYFHALQLMKEIQPIMIIIYNNIGSVYISQKNLDLALENLEKAILIYNQVINPDKASIIATYNNLGLVYSIRKQYDLSEEFYLKALLHIKECEGEESINIDKVQWNYDKMRVKRAYSLFLQGDQSQIKDLKRELGVDRLKQLLKNFGVDDSVV